MFQKLKHFIFQFFLRLKTKKEISRQPVSLHNAKSIGILFYAIDIKQNDILIQFVQKLKSERIDVQLLGYMPKREFGFVYPFPFISEKDTNWFGKPGGGTSGYFMRSPFDLLINFCEEGCLPLDYLSAFSMANFRVGFNAEADIANYDLILITKEKCDISKRIENLELYLK